MKESPRVGNMSKTPNDSIGGSPFNVTIKNIDEIIAHERKKLIDK